VRIAPRLIVVLTLLTCCLGLTAPGAIAGSIDEFTAGLQPNSQPRKIVVGPDGNLWFTDARGAIGRSTAAGVITEFSSGLNVGSEPGDMVAGPDGNLWFTDAPFPGAGAAAIGRITPSGDITEFSTGVDQDGDPATLDEPLDIVTGPDGNIWFADRAFLGGTPSVGRITPSGAITEYELPGYSKPSSLVVGPDGNIWFANAGIAPNLQSVGMITTSGAISEYLTPERSAGSLVTGPDGNLWFTATSTAANAAIGRITTTGSLAWFSTGLMEPSTPELITVGPDGNLWFSDRGGFGTQRAVGKITTGGTITEYPGEIAASEIVTGPDGNVWVADEFGSISRYTPTGTKTTFTSGLKEGTEPHDLVIGPGGANLWFTDWEAIGTIAPVAPGGVTPLPTLDVEIRGAGSGWIASSPAGIACSADCSGQFPAGAAVDLSAAPGSSSVFMGWFNGPCAGAGNCQVTMNRDVSVLAEFEESGLDPGDGPQPKTDIPPNVTAPAQRPPQRLKCRKGFKKKRVRGKTRCVKIKKKHRARRDA
jgi:streptogramin lyase